MPGGSDYTGWATRPQDTREQTCESHDVSPFSVMTTFRVSRAPDPTTVTVTRTAEVAVEWTTTLPLPEWLATIAAVCTPYGGDRFESSPKPTNPAADGRFQAAPVDATVSPSGGESPALSEPYHYWNTPLGRLQADDHYPEGMRRVTVDLVDGPDALWTDESIAGVRADRLPEDRSTYARAGLRFFARERHQRPTDSGDGPDTGWQSVGTPSPLTTEPLADAVRETLADPVRAAVDDRDRETRDMEPGTKPEPGTGKTERTRTEPGANTGELPDTDEPRDRLGRSTETGSIGPATVRVAVETVRNQADAVWSAFRWDGDSDPYGIPAAAVRAATSPE